MKPYHICQLTVSVMFWWLSLGSKTQTLQYQNGELKLIVCHCSIADTCMYVGSLSGELWKCCYMMLPGSVTSWWHTNNFCNKTHLLVWPLTNSGLKRTCARLLSHSWLFLTRTTPVVIHITSIYEKLYLKYHSSWSSYCTFDWLDMKYNVGLNLLITSSDNTQGECNTSHKGATSTNLHILAH